MFTIKHIDHNCVVEEIQLTEFSVQEAVNAIGFSFEDMVELLVVRDYDHSIDTYDVIIGAKYTTIIIQPISTDNHFIIGLTDDFVVTC